MCQCPLPVHFVSKSYTLEEPDAASTEKTKAGLGWEDQKLKHEGTAHAGTNQVYDVQIIIMHPDPEELITFLPSFVLIAKSEVQQCLFHVLLNRRTFQIPRLRQAPKF